MKTVLLVDDEDDIREVAQMSLEVTAGWNIEGANCGTAGIEKAKSLKPDAILLDVMMPDMDGPTTFKKIQEIPELEGTPVILMTAKVQASDLEQFKAIGVSGVIAKPFDPMSLAEQVKEILSWS
ncbi:MAG: response regulator [Candidatus Eremiobacteraeota bacterium]|nr:response regulator [Candidatus Eremiobacteraeota bacterium]